MNDLTLLLMRQKDLYERSIEAFDELRQTLRHNSSGAGVSAAVHKTEPVLAELGELDEDIGEYLRRCGKKTLYEEIEAQTDAAERETVMRLFDGTAKLQLELKNVIDNVKDLLRRSKLFVDFHLNVASKVQADSTYGPPGATETATQSRKIFDANA